MIQVRSILNVIDNSGGRKVSCIKVSKGYRKRYSFIGDVILVSIKSIKNKKKGVLKVKKGDVSKALIVRTRKVNKKKFHEFLTFKENAVVLLNKQNKFLGTRIFGCIPKDFRYTRFLKGIVLCAGAV